MVDGCQAQTFVEEDSTESGGSFWAVVLLLMVQLRFKLCCYLACTTGQHNLLDFFLAFSSGNDSDYKETHGLVDHNLSLVRGRNPSYGQSCSPGSRAIVKAHPHRVAGSSPWLTICYTSVTWLLRCYLVTTLIYGLCMYVCMYVFMLPTVYWLDRGKF
jgi:hypothetical protein